MQIYLHLFTKSIWGHYLQDLQAKIVSEDQLDPQHFQNDLNR